MTTNEPVIVINSVVAVIVAVLAALVTGGVIQVSKDQQDMIVGIIVSIGALVATFLARSQVTPTNKA
jgi:predicted exporter